MSTLELSVFLAYSSLLLVLSLYGSHRIWMVYLHYRHKYRLPTPAARYETLPRITVQLPMFNELYVAERVIDAACRLEYPADRLQIQVLDDSIDETQGIARACVERWRAKGVDVVYVHRVNRQGFKAGALEHGLATATGEFVAVFDADFLPPADYLLRSIHHFTDPRVAVVQARWGHINRGHSLLTRAQAIFLDGHFMVEHSARSRSGRFFNFNGTAGMWRKAAIVDGGGWQHDTITEDLDLSYRTQVKGWKFVFLPDVVTPAELPEDMNAFKAQQHRWAKGSIQVALKLWPMLRKADLSKELRKEAFFHLTANLAWLVMIPLAILLPISCVVRVSHGVFEVLLVDLPFAVMATLSVLMFYAVSQAEQGASWWDRVKHLPFVMALGIGLSINNARAVVEALMGYETGFVRTPKAGVGGPAPAVKAKKKGGYKAAATLQPLVELAMAAYMTYGVVYLMRREVYYSIPFLVLFQVGYGYVALVSIYEGLRGRVIRLARVLSPARVAE
jgi:cellulose synthase/poly-beta-1,6-N-acetylglucosamine synthase-like glycosyltransferase